jgi:hypothetical protein
MDLYFTKPVAVESGFRKSETALHYEPNTIVLPTRPAMNNEITPPIRESYDRLADEYARRIFNELQHKPLDRQLLNRFAAEMAGRGEVCDMGCGPVMSPGICGMSAQPSSA